MINFTKNMALVGAAMTMMQLEEPWPVSVDGLRWTEGEIGGLEEEMYVRMGGRDLRALPA